MNNRSNGQSKAEAEAEAETYSAKSAQTFNSIKFERKMSN